MKKNNTNLLWMAVGVIGAWFFLREKTGKVNKYNDRYIVRDDELQVVSKEKDINEISKDGVLPLNPTIDVRDKIIL